jgi:MoaA/NifB/PqqE/SkfB family radical SAM enzyme
MNSKDYFLHDALCTLPWIGVFVNPNGTIKNCAIVTEALGNIHNTPIEEILTGTTNVTIKTDMLNHVRHTRCNACYKVENLSDNSFQTHSSSNRSWYKKYGIKNLDLYDSPDNFKLKILDLRWRNTCNLACVYCGPDLSSKWADELNNTDYTINENILEKNKKYIFDQIDTIDHVYLAGGEPLLIKENLELLNLLADRNPNVEIRINTNLSVVDNKIFKKLLTFKNVKWTVSVEAADNEYNYIRYPGNWDRFYSNLIDLKNKEFDINFNMVWCVLNSESIFKCIEDFQAVGFHENAFIIQCLDGPLPLDVRNLPASQLENIKSTIKNKLTTTNPKYWLHKSLEIMYNYINTPFPSGKLEQTFSFLKTLDDRRNIDSRAVFPWLYKL